MFLPGWARELASRYFSRTQSTFILHGNTRDLIRFDDGSAAVRYVPLVEYLTRALFARRKFVLGYDLSRGLYLADPSAADEFARKLRAIDAVAGTRWTAELPSSPHAVILFFQRFVKALAVSPDPESRRVALILDWAETIFPKADLPQLSAEDRAAEIALERLAESREVIDGDVTLVLITEDLSSLSSRIVENAYTSPICVPIPSEPERREYISWWLSSEGRGANSASAAQFLSQLQSVSAASAGLTLTQIGHILAEYEQDTTGGAKKDWRDYIYERKRRLIEQSCAGMLEFVGSEKQTLDLVAVHDLAVAELRKDAALFRAGEFAAVPSGYLICGPSGCGKSFLVRCFAGEAGVPCVELRNFRDKWVGATEANLDRLLSVLSALSPVAVIVDEADAALGDRGAGEGDSGLSGRVFSRLISFMGDPKNRGRVVWFLITNRPDLLSIDLKRQGRAEKHIPLFAPQSAADYEDLFLAYRKKHKLPLGFSRLADACDPAALKLSGSDLESVFFRAYARAKTAKSEDIEASHFKEALEDFISPQYPDEIEYQTLLAVAESTSRALIPKKYRMEQRALAERLAELKTRLPRG